MTNYFFKRIYLITILIVIFSPLSSLAQKIENDYELNIAKVKEVSDIDINEKAEALEQIVQLELIDGPHKGKSFFTRNLIPDNKAYSIIAKKNKKYLVAVENNGEEAYITDYYRQGSIITIIAVFLILLAFIGGMQGIKAILSLVITGLSIFFILLPAIKNGFNPLLVATFVAGLATATTMLLIAGFSKKSLSATVGTTGGVLAAGVLALLVIKFAPLSGLASSEARILLANNLASETGNNIDFQGVLAAGILIASLGAAMDVAISIASSAQELFITDPEQSPAQLFKHLMIVGKDIMGTMTNTLILAYTGASIPLFLLLSDNPLNKTLNMEIIATELTAAVVGSIGLLLAIPITAFISTFLLKPPSQNYSAKYLKSHTVPYKSKIKGKIHG